MAKVNISNVEVKDNPCNFCKPFQFEITFECIEDLNDDLEWKIIYVGSAESEEYDQTLDSVVVGPIIAGRHMFVFEADPPDPNRIPREDAVGVTVVLVACSYKNQEFIRVGYYVNNEYMDPEFKENPPNEPQYDKLQRNILATCPRVTRFKIDWGGSDDGENMPPASSTENESNQMAVEGDGSRQSLLSKDATAAELSSAASKLEVLMEGGASTASGFTSILNGGAVDSASTAAEPMQM